MADAKTQTRQALIDQLKAKGIDNVFGRPLYRVLKEELEFAVRQNAPSYLSFSAVNTYLNCGLSYYYRYILGLKLPPAGVMILGTAAHKGMEHDFKQKIESHENLPTKEVLEVFSDTFDKERDNAIWKEDEEAGDMKDKTAAALTLYHAGNDTLPSRAKQLQPVEVEKKFVLKFDNVDYDLIGYVDILTVDEQLRDIKRKGKKMNQAEIDKDMQLSVYALAYKEKTGHFPKSLGFDCMITTKTPQVDICETTRTDEDCLRALAVTARVADGIYKHVYLPAQSSAWNCSPKWCGYWDICHKELV